MMWNKQIIINNIKELYKFGKHVNYQSIYNTDKKLIYAAEKYFGNWSKALLASGINPNSIKKLQSWNKEKIVTKILELHKNGVKLNSSSIQKTNVLLFGAANRHLGGWKNALDTAGIKIKCPRKYILSDVKQIIEDKGGKCLSDVYVNTTTKLKIQCSNGHIWETALANMLYSNSWCPHCTIWITQEKCRYIFESFVGKRFSTNHDILGNRMSLDGYCKDLSLAFEYNGKQHYEYVSRFHKKAQDLTNQKNRDKVKRKLCIKLGIKLIEVPFDVFIKNEEFVFIKKELQNKSIPIICDKISINYPNFNQLKINEYQELARKKNGKLISNEYLGSDKKLEWECEHGHRWKSVVQTVKGGHWCPTCAGVARKTIQDMNCYAASQNGKCISKVYVNITTKLEWECEYGHRWKASPSSMMYGRKSWCPICAIETIRKKRTKYSIEIVNQFVSKKGGKCISKEYRSTHEKLKFQCENGHIWETRFHDIKRGSWCPRCSPVINQFSFQQFW